MTTITLFKFDELPEKPILLEKLKETNSERFLIRARQSKYNEHEVLLDASFEEDIETGMKRIFSEDTFEVVEYLKEKGKEKVIRKVYCFIDTNKKVLEIYRGPDFVTYKLKEAIEEVLNATSAPVSLTSNQLLKIVKENSSELKQVMFKYIHGLWYHIMRGRHVEENKKYKSYLEAKPDSLRVVSIVPKIFYSNGRDYMVTINGDKGTVRLCDGFLKIKPRFEIRQIVSLVLSAAGSF